MSTQPTRRRNILFAIPAVLALILDQWTKILARAELLPLGRGQSVTVIDGYFNLRYSENTGVAFGLFQALPGGRVILTVVALLALALVIYYLKRTPPAEIKLPLALGLIAGGAIGNLVDRIAFGRVTDFIVWHYHGTEWPAFNIADAALVVGVILMALDMFRRDRPVATSTSDSRS